MIPVPVTLTRRGWGIALAAVLLAGAWFAVRLHDLWYLVALLASLVLLGVLGALVLGRLQRLSVTLLATNPTPHAGSTIGVTAIVTRGLPGRFDGLLEWQLQAAAGPPAAEPLHIPRRGTANVSQQWIAEHRGPLTVGVRAISLTDPLGIAVRRMRRRDTIELLVLPRLIEQLPEQESWIEHAARLEVPIGGRVAGSGSPGGAVREYRPGDARREIHWKQSAKQNELLVRMQDPVDAPERVLTLNTDASTYDSGDAFERAVSLAATAGVRWIRRGYAVRLGYGDHPVGVFTREGELLRRLALVKLGDES